jgi:hypothetical protein
MAWAALMLLALRREKWWLVANAFGVFAFLHMATKTWREPELRGVEIATSGVALVWAFTALPVLVSFFAINTVWLVLGDHQRNKTGDWRQLTVAIGVVAVWVGVAVLDQLNH